MYTCAITVLLKASVCACVRAQEATEWERAAGAEAAASEALLAEALGEAVQSEALPLDRLPLVQEARAAEARARAAEVEANARLAHKLRVALDARSQLDAKLAAAEQRGREVRPQYSGTTVRWWGTAWPKACTGSRWAASLHTSSPPFATPFALPIHPPATRPPAARAPPEGGRGALRQAKQGGCAQVCQLCHVMKGPC
jgi:hypothetical protein